jgi:hypothetical protein
LWSNSISLNRKRSPDYSGDIYANPALARFICEQSFQDPELPAWIFMGNGATE